jgi:hypothetical protein
MLRHSTNTASFFSNLMAALIFSLFLAGIAAAQGNTSLGTGALQSNTTGSYNTAIGSAPMPISRCWESENATAIALEPTSMPTIRSPPQTTPR